MAAKGVKVKHLESYPDMTEADNYYLEMYRDCGKSVSEISAYCGIRGLSRQETLEAVKILLLI